MGDSPRHIVWWIFVKEVLDLVRDRRAVCFAFVLPLLLHPIFFLFVSGSKHQEEEKLAERELTIGVAGDFVDLLPFLEERQFAMESVGLAESAALVESEQLAAVVAFQDVPDLDQDASEAPLHATVYYRAVAPDSQEARRRLTSALNEYRDSLLVDRFTQRAVHVNLDGLAAVSSESIASAQQLSDASLGRLLPLLIVVLLLTGGSFAAIDLVAGEKERGTLETLYIHPIDTSAIVQGKFFVILFASLASVTLNLVGIVLCLQAGAWFGWEPLGIENAPLSIPALSTLALVMVFTAPLAVLTSAALLALSAYAGSYRETQTYLLPLTLIALVLALPALSPFADLESVVLLVPVGGVVLVVREVLQGHFAWGPCGIVFATSTVYAIVVLRWAAALLRREDVVLRLEMPPLALEETAEGRARRGIFFGAVMLLAVYFGASALQTWHAYLGLFLTLWGVVLVPAVAYPLVLRLPMAELLGFRATRLTNYPLALLAAAASLVLLSAYMRAQDAFLPFPESLQEAFRELLGEGELTAMARFFLLALSPGVCEEILWRGVVQGEVAQRRRPLFTMVVVGIFFGLFHLSIYRFLPTGVLGALLAFVRFRSGSIFPCMVLHTAYNALAIFFLAPILEDSAVAVALHHPASLVGAALVLVLSLRGMRDRQ